MNDNDMKKLELIKGILRECPEGNPEGFRDELEWTIEMLDESEASRKKMQAVLTALEEVLENAGEILAEKLNEVGESILAGWSAGERSAP